MQGARSIRILKQFMAALSPPLNFRYSSYRFGGKKKIILSTTSWLGGRNDFLSIAYLVVGCASFAAALVFTAALQRWPRKLGDPRLLSWNKVKLV